MKTATIEITETATGIYGYIEPGKYTFTMPDSYDPKLITAADVVSDCQIEAVIDGKAEATLALAIVGQMSDDERASYDRANWYDGVSSQCLLGEDLATVLNYIDEIV